MRRRLLLIGAGAFGSLALTGCSSTSQEMQTDEASLVTSATATVGVLKANGGTNAADLLQKAKAVLIFPDLINGGVGVGASRGQGVLLARSQQGWSYPAFYETSSISLGLQLGAEESSVVMFVMSQRALDNLMQSNNFSLKAGGGLSLVDFNAATQAQLEGADVVVWSKSKGAYGGLTLSGSDVSQRLDRDKSYYGKPVNVTQIAQGAVSNKQADSLRTALGG